MARVTGRHQLLLQRRSIAALDGVPQFLSALLGGLADCPAHFGRAMTDLPARLGGGVADLQADILCALSDFVEGQADCTASVPGAAHYGRILGRILCRCRRAVKGSKQDCRDDAQAPSY